MRACVRAQCAYARRVRASLRAKKKCPESLVGTHAAGNCSALQQGTRSLVFKMLVGVSLLYCSLSTNLVIYLTRVMGEDSGFAAIQARRGAGRVVVRCKGGVRRAQGGWWSNAKGRGLLRRRG